MQASALKPGMTICTNFGKMTLTNVRPSRLYSGLTVLVAGNLTMMFPPETEIEVVK